MTRRRPLVTLLILVAIGALVSVQAGLGDLWPDPPPDPLPWPATTADAQARPTLGVTTAALARNADEPWTQRDLVEVNAFEQAARSPTGIVMWFADWANTPRFDARQARAVAARGAIPAVSWEPWDAARGPSVAQPRYRLATIIAGRHDALLRRWGRDLAAYGGPVRIRFAHEMNGRWYPWAEAFNGNRPGEYVRAWRHVRSVVRAEGATNVEWIWCPVTGQVPVSMFPGRDEVDVIGVSGFNGGPRLFSRRWRTFGEAFGDTLTDLHALAPEHPIELSEIATTEEGGDKAAWIRDMFADVARRTYVRSLVWFDVEKEADWRITSSPAAARAFAAGLAAARRP